ncbi:MAG TPA: SAM-dependent methyltransferase [Thermoplasmata archaeon]|nr:SAM-dependent methyltransferase [Thermoplasmata archaeon]
MAERARSERLADRLREEIARAGPMPFDRFVELALYHPADGYYVQADRALGRGGDFYTAPHVHPIFARTVARRILAAYRELGRPGGFQLAEVAAGDGTLALDLLDAWSAPGAEAPAGEHVLIDLPGPRLLAVGERVRAHGGPGAWTVRTAAVLGDRGPMRGVILANELLDALPFRRLVRRHGAWRELGVGARDGALVWEEADLVRPIGPPDLPELPEGALLEISEAAEAWVRQAADLLVDGNLLLLDYGFVESEGTPGGPNGTLRALRGHRAVDALDGPGTADLSAFVDFTRIRAAAERAGLRELAFRRQPEALGAWGFESVLAEALQSAGSAEAQVRIRLAAKNLIFGFEGFRVLELAPGPR